MVVTGHQVDPALIRAVQDVSQEFFDLPEAEKLKLTSPIDAIIRGYSPMMGEGLSFSIGEEAPGDIEEGAAQVHGITTEQLQDKPLFAAWEPTRGVGASIFPWLIAYLPGRPRIVTQ